MSDRGSWRVIRVCVVCCLLPFLARPLLASSIRQVDLNEMVGVAEMIFEGRVIARDSRFTPDGSAIWTEVTFEVLEVIKGDQFIRTVRLPFLGGRVGELSLQVADLLMPEEGEQGVYFVETTQRRQPHPLYGWSQGHFVVRRDGSGVERMSTRTGRTVVSLSEDSAGPGLLSTGVASGVKTAETSLDRALSLPEFKGQIRSLLSANR